MEEPQFGPGRAGQFLADGNLDSGRLHLNLFDRSLDKNLGCAAKIPARIETL